MGVAHFWKMVSNSLEGVGEDLSIECSLLKCTIQIFLYLAKALMIEKWDLVVDCIVFIFFLTDTYACIF